ncbi:hypothetical protein B5807_09490 [Epicoccum nigrum]|uniref:Uncharacterized protein n=1 Tax=Epicoccum nigrum TaxID=105696 RepID=A0A1Y2LNX2_EPING|nr:hypothetical protein B5807_09490 [Epicoccum nigrum]
MAAEWIQMQREGWLCQLYGVDNEDGTRVLPPNGVHVKLVSIMEKLLSMDISPSDAATQTAALVMTQKDVHTPASNLVGIYYGAVQDIDDEKISGVLVDYLAELASLPDAINEGPEMKIVWTGLGDEYVEPGQPIVFETGKLWRDLPEFGWNLTEILQGPEQYLKMHGGRKEPLGAMQAWKNLNTYLALRAVHPKAQTIPAMVNKTLCFRIFVMALEQRSDSRLGRNSELHAPAAAQWLRIAGDEIEQLCKGTETWPEGQLWKDHGGTNRCDGARLTFWKSRLRDMGYWTTTVYYV